MELRAAMKKQHQKQREVDEQTEFDSEMWRCTKAKGGIKLTII